MSVGLCATLPGLCRLRLQCSGRGHFPLRTPRDRVLSGAFNAGRETLQAAGADPAGFRTSNRPAHTAMAFPAGES